MKKFHVTFFIALSLASYSDAQPCKTVNPGMNPDQVIEAAGEPFSVDTVGASFSNRTRIFDSDKPKMQQYTGDGELMIVWNYGDQEVQFYNDEVRQIDIGTLKIREASRKFFEGEIDIFEWERLERKLKD